jgi:exodeoxyribonuclease VII small subunit
MPKKAESEATSSPVPFEKQLEELEGVVKRLEAGDLPLETSLQLFENAVDLSSNCRRILSEAETRVEKLLKKGAEAVPFDEEDA